MYLPSFQKAPIVKELEKYLNYWNLYLKIMVLKRPKLHTEEHPESIQKNKRSAHYNSSGTTQRPRQSPGIILPQDTNRMYQPN